MAERTLKLVRPDDRALPWDEEAEVSVLGAMLIDGDAAVQAVSLTSDDDFHREAHRRTFRALAALVERREVVDPVTLQAELARAGDLDAVGGHAWVAELLDAVPTAANIEYHIRLVQDCARRRQLIRAGTEIVRMAHEPAGLPASTLVDRAEQLVVACAEQAKGEARSVRETMMEVLEQAEAATRNPGQLAGLSWGLADIDEQTGGLQKGDLIIVAARPSMGKTALVTGVALHVAITQQAPVAFFSLEMSRLQVVQRMLCHESLVDIARLRRGRLQDDDYGRLAQASGHLSAARMVVDDTGALTVPEMRARLRKTAADDDLGLVVVDYIQLMSGPGESRQQEVTAISRGLKALAREFDVPLIALSQLSRAPEQRSNHRPQLSDLRESGAIEQDADLVGFLYRPEYYVTAAEAQENKLHGKAEFIIGKQRNGPTGAVDLYFRRECARFESLAESRWGVR